MTTGHDSTPDPRFDLVLERITDVAPELVWRAWTEPEHLMPWFCPRPWSVSECEIDLRPGGTFRTVMRSPEGEAFPNVGCYLEVVPGRRLVWTDALLAGYRPAPNSTLEGFHFTAIIEIEPHGTGTRYVATAMHPDEDSRLKHEAMGFYDGWGTAWAQLEEHARTM